MRPLYIFLLLTVLIACRKEPENRPIIPPAAAIKESEIPQLSGVTLWLKAENLKLVSGDTIGEWKDAIDPSRSFSQSELDAQPKFVSAGINNLPSIEFDGLNDSLFSGPLKLSDVANKEDVSFFAVASIKSVSTNSPNPWLNNPLFIDRKGQFGVTISETSILFFNYVNTNTLSANPFEIKKPLLINAVLHNETLYGRTNKMAFQESKTENILDLDSPLYLGGGSNGSDYLDGMVSEILFFKKQTAEEREKIAQYLLNKYNLQ